jgi:DNA-binding beta-propeller fold protein YncE
MAGVLGDAGSDEDHFRSPSGLVELDGMLYVSDRVDGSIRSVDLSTGAISTLSDGVYSPHHLATDGSLIYVADQSGAVYSVAPSTGELTKLAGGSRGHSDGCGTDARFRSPSGILYHEDSGQLVVSDYDSGTIRLVDPDSGCVDTLAGKDMADWILTDGTGSEARFSGPLGLGAMSDGRVLVADSQSGVYRAVDIGSGSVQTWIGDGRKPGSLAPGASGPGYEVTFSQPEAIAVGDDVVLALAEGAVYRFSPE